MYKKEIDLLEALKEPLGKQEVWRTVARVLLEGGVGSEDLDEDCMCEGLERALIPFIKNGGDALMLNRVAFRAAFKAHCMGQWNEGQQKSRDFFVKRLKSKLDLHDALWPRSMCCGLLAMQMIRLDVDPPSDQLVPLVHQLVEHYLDEKEDKRFCYFASAFVQGLVTLTRYSVDQFKDGTALKDYEKREEEELERMLRR